MKAETVLKVVGPPIVLALGVGVFMLLVKTRPEVAKADAQERAPLVKVMTAEAVNHTLTVPGQGTVTAARQVVLQPEVSARVQQVHPRLVAGGLLKAGETVVELNSRDYQLAITQQRANVQRARLELEMEQGLQKVARREWELFGEDKPQDPEEGKLALRKPHIQNARANLAAANSAVAQASNNLAKTRLEAPFNAMVLSESVDVGMLASPQTPLATLVGTDAYWVQVSMPYDQLPKLKVPGLNAGADEGAAAKVTLDAGAATTSFDGRVLRLLGDMDPVGRLARLVVEVKDPLGLERDGTTWPLLLGAFVKVEITGETLQGVVALPRTAVHSGDTAWVVSGDGTLHIRTLEVAWRTPERVYARGGVTPGEQVITSRLDGAIDGMKVRTSSGATAGDDAAKEAP